MNEITDRTFSIRWITILEFTIYKIPLNLADGAKCERIVIVLMLLRYVDIPMGLITQNRAQKAESQTTGYFPHEKNQREKKKSTFNYTIELDLSLCGWEFCRFNRKSV